MRLADYQAPVAHSMIKLLQNIVLKQFEPFNKFIFYWTAFNNIYVTVAEMNGKKASLDYDNGVPKTRSIGGLKISKVKTVQEKDQLMHIFSDFPKELKINLIMHESTKYFVYRTPSWNSKKIVRDAFGQKLNGVINVGYTVDSNYPVWSPINTDLYERYVSKHNDTSMNLLAEQILWVLYTIRNNTFHGGKRFDDANDRYVVSKAVPLLEMIVMNYVDVAQPQAGADGCIA